MTGIIALFLVIITVWVFVEHTEWFLFLLLLFLIFTSIFCEDEQETEETEKPAIEVVTEPKTLEIPDEVIKDLDVPTKPLPTPKKKECSEYQKSIYGKCIN